MRGTEDDVRLAAAHCNPSFESGNVGTVLDDEMIVYVVPKT